MQESVSTLLWEVCWRPGGLDWAWRPPESNIYMRGAAPQVRGRAEAVISVTSPTSAATVAAAAGGGSSQAQPNKNITSDTRLCRGLAPLLITNSLSFVRLLLCPDPEQNSITTYYTCLVLSVKESPYQVPWSKLETSSYKCFEEGCNINAP